MKTKTHLSTCVAVLATLVGTANALDYQGVYSNVQAGAAVGTIIADINGVFCRAGVDTDGDGNKEIVLLRVDGTNDSAQLFIYEATGADNGYALKYSDRITGEGGPSNFSSYGYMDVVDWDGANGPEIIVGFAGPGGSVTRNLMAYASTANDTWGAGNTVADNEFSQGLLLQPPAAADGDSEPLGFAFGDPDGDSVTEIVLIDDEQNAVIVASIASGTWAGGNVVLTSEADLGPVPSSPYAAQIADLNGDGSADIVVGIYQNAAMAAYEGTAANTYALAKLNSPGLDTLNAYTDNVVRPESLLIADVDGDGVPTVFFAASGGGNIWTVDGIASGALSTLGGIAATPFVNGGADLGIVPSGTQTDGNAQAIYAIKLTDLDLDGNKEIVIAMQDAPSVATPDNGELVILEYKGTGSEAALASYDITRAPASGLTMPEFVSDFATGSTTAILDMDGDGLGEIVVASSGIGLTNPIVTVFEVTPPVLNVEDFMMWQ